LNKKALVCFIFTVYCVFLAYVLFLRETDGLGMSIEAIKTRFETGANLTPLKTINSYYRAYNSEAISPTTYKLNIYGNVLLFVPMGALLPRLKRLLRPLISTVLNVAAVVVIAEALQLVYGVGRADIDDVILNLSGTVIGWIIFHPRKEKAKQIP